MIAAAPVARIVELGSGSARKTAHLLREQVRQRGGGLFAPLDVSLSSLVASRDHIARQFSGLDFLGLQARFEDGVAALDHSRPTLFAFLGSTIGNFTRAEFIRFFDHLSAHMAAGDFLLLRGNLEGDQRLL
jgi:L-histidine N-alpha-methyltransferase